VPIMALSLSSSPTACTKISLRLEVAAVVGQSRVRVVLPVEQTRINPQLGRMGLILVHRQISGTRA